MKIFEDKEEIKIIPEDEYDIWRLYKIISNKKFEVGSITLRVIKVDDKEKKVKAFIWIFGEKINFERGKIRITGKIVSSSNEEVPIGVYHSIDITVGNKYSFKINLFNWEKKFLNRNKIKKRIILVSFDYGDTLIYSLNGKLKKIEEIKEKLPGKEDSNYSKFRENYLNNVIKKLDKIKGDNPLIIGAHSVLIDSIKPLIKAIFIPVGNTGERGIFEIIKRGGIKQIEKENRISKEVEDVDEFLRRISNNKLIVYGEKDTEKAVKWGAVDKLLVSEDCLFKDKKIQSIVNEAENKNTRIDIISTDHELGIQFKHFCIAGFLRYQI